MKNFSNLERNNMYKVGDQKFIFVNNKCEVYTRSRNQNITVRGSKCKLNKVNTRILLYLNQFPNKTNDK